MKPGASSASPWTEQRLTDPAQGPWGLRRSHSSQGCPQASAQRLWATGEILHRIPPGLQGPRGLGCGGIDPRPVHRVIHRLWGYFREGCSADRDGACPEERPLPSPLPEGRGDRSVCLDTLESAGYCGVRLKPCFQPARTSPLSLQGGARSRGLGRGSGVKPKYQGHLETPFASKLAPTRCKNTPPRKRGPGPLRSLQGRFSRRLRRPGRPLSCPVP